MFISINEHNQPNLKVMFVIFSNLGWTARECLFWNDQNCVQILLHHTFYLYSFRRASIFTSAKWRLAIFTFESGVKIKWDHVYKSF